VKNVRWGLCLVGGLAAFATSLLLTALVVSAYAITVSLDLGGASSPLRVEEFAGQLAPLMGPMLLIMTTIVAARRVARHTTSPALHGTVVGVVAATAALFPAWPIDFRDVIITIAAIGAGGIAGAVVNRKAS
jgi:hypothetical protein